MIKAMQWTDWLRLTLALTITGLLLYHNSDLTKKAGDWFGINSRNGYLYELIR